jgi:hypothetical protein
MRVFSRQYASKIWSTGYLFNAGGLHLPGASYIFIHRLIMEHFAEMDV